MALTNRIFFDTYCNSTKDILVIPLISACVKIVTKDTSILCDPWFTPGIHGGTWYQFPKLTSFLELIGDIDFIYISHLHEDHYDPISLSHILSSIEKQYKKIPEILISTRTNFNHLLKIMQRDGFNPVVGDFFECGNTSFYLQEDYKEGDPGNVDSLLVVRTLDHCVVNMNDVPYDPDFTPELVSKLNIKSPDILLTAHCGAGPYPQMYFDEIYLSRMHLDKLFFNIQKFKSMINAFEPSYVIPFAADYLLGSGLSHFNQFRGMYDTFYASKLDHRVRSFDLRLNLSFLRASDGHQVGAQTEPTEFYEGYEEYLYSINNLPRHEYYPSLSTSEKYLQLESSWSSMLSRFSRHLASSIPDNINHLFRFQVLNGYSDIASPVKTLNLLINDHNHPDEVTDIFINVDTLLACITKKLHWNNVSGGSQAFFRRNPKSKYGYTAESYLNFIS